MLSKIKKLIGKNKKWVSSFPIFKVNNPLPDNKFIPYYLRVKEKLKYISTEDMIIELNRRKNENIDKYPINYIIGSSSGDIYLGNQSPNKTNAICHACGLGDKCVNVDCPNEKVDPSSPWIFY